MIDVQLLKLRYEILNISLENLSSEVGVPLSVLKDEASNKGWKQWWPEEPASQIFPSSGQHCPSEDTLLIDQNPLEDEAQQYIRSTRMRLQVFQLAKEVYLAHKYASFESLLMDKAKDIVDGCTCPQDLSQMSTMLKNLASKIGTQLAITDDDGVPTVIIRDLSGRLT